jgi:hypothetical protein
MTNSPSTGGQVNDKKCPPGHVWSDGNCHDTGKGNDPNKDRGNGNDNGKGNGKGNGKK